MEAVRGVVATELPLSFAEKRDETATKRLGSVVGLLLAPLAHPRLRCAPLLAELLASPALVEQPLTSPPHPYLIPTADACGSLAAAVLSPGGAACGCSAEELWAFLSPSLFDPSAPWQRRRAMLLGLILVPNPKRNLTLTLTLNLTKAPAQALPLNLILPLVTRQLYL